MNSGRINIETGRFNIVSVNKRAISLTKMKITSMAKTLLASVKIAPLSKNSSNLDKYFSGTIFSKNIVKSSII